MKTTLDASLENYQKIAKEKDGWSHKVGEFDRRLAERDSEIKELNLKLIEFEEF